MKLSTHAVFSAGAVLAVALRILPGNQPVALLMSGVSALMQYVMDGLSHAEVGGVRRRTPLFHSPAGALLSTVAFCAVILLVTRDASLLPVAALCGAISGFSHIALDLPTERGIYVRGRRTSSRRLLRYDNPALNALFTLLGLIMIVCSLPTP